MKKIEAVVRPDAVRGVLDALSDAGYPGVMVIDIEGHGRQKGISQNWRGQEYKLDLLPKSKLEIVANDDQVEEIMETIARVARTGQIGDGKVFVSEIADAFRIRTGDRGEAALV